MRKSSLNTLEPEITAVVVLDEVNKNLEQTLQSLFVAGWNTALDAIIVSCGTKDLSSIKARDWCSKHEWAQYIELDEKTYEGALAKACALAKGQFIAFLRPNDTWHPNHARNLLASFSEDRRVSMVVNAWRSFSNGLQIDFHFHDVSPGVVQNHFLSMAWGDSYAALSAVGVRRSCLEKFGGISTTHGDDFDRILYANCALNGVILKTSNQGATVLQDVEQNLTRFEKKTGYTNWLEAKIHELQGTSPAGCRLTGAILKRQMEENLIFDCLHTGSLAATRGMDRLRDHFALTLRGLGRTDLADEVLKIAPGSAAPLRLSWK